jgi:ubiquinone/menaquinone biosynthesis C-methylase UbiE
MSAQTAMPEPIIHTSTVIEAFTQLAPGYEDCMQQELKQFWGVGYQEFIRALARLADIQDGERVLDIATGTARIPRQVLESGARPGTLVGLDITFAMLAEGKARIEENARHQAIRLVCGSAIDLPFACGSLDVVLCGLGTHHIQVPQLVAEMRRVLRPGGKLVLADVCASWFWRSKLGDFMIRSMAQKYQADNQTARTEAELEAFPNVRTIDEWRAILHANDFNHIEMQATKPRWPWYPGGFQARALAGASATTTEEGT